MAEVVYLLCAATSLFCAILLARSYRAQRSRLLLLATVCFVGLTINSVIVVFDLVLIPDIDLRPARTLVAYLSILSFLLGLIWESR